MGNLVNRDYEPTLAKVGDVAKVYTGISGAEIVMNTHAEATFQIPDITKVLAVPDLLRVYMQPAVIAIAEKIESDLLNLYAGFTANSPLGTAGAPITEALIDQAETALFQAKVPTNRPKYLIVDSATYSQMRQIPRFSEFQTAGGAGLRTMIDGTIGKIKDFYVFRSRSIQVTGVDPANMHNLAFVKESIGMAMRRIPQPLPGTGLIAEYSELGNFGMKVSMSYQPNTLSQQFTVEVLYGCAILNDAWAVQVNS